MTIQAPSGLGAGLRSMIKDRQTAAKHGAPARSRFQRAIRTAFNKQFGFRFKDDPSFDQALEKLINCPLDLCLDTVDLTKFMRGIQKPTGLLDTIRGMEEHILREERGAVFFRVSSMTTPWVAVVGEPPTVVRGQWSLLLFTGGSFPNVHMMPFPAFARMYTPCWTGGELVPDGMSEWFIADDELQEPTT
jgi:hypothetical protein